jgi:FixJ family two-component response regulator
MPGLSGSEMSRAMLELRPDLPIMLCTGFSDQIDEESARKQGIRSFMMKPIKNQELLRQARSLLSENLPTAANA